MLPCLEAHGATAHNNTPAGDRGGTGGRCRGQARACSNQGQTLTKVMTVNTRVGFARD